jgi:hypothetical protein
MVGNDLNTHDREMLHEFYSCFDRPAFKVNFKHESDLEALIMAIDDTIAAINTGIKVRRDGVQFGKAVDGKSYFNNKELHKAFNEIVDILTEIKILYTKAKDAGFFYFDRRWVAFHSAHSEEASKVAVLIDEARNKVLEIANQIYVQLGYREFSYIDPMEYYKGFEELAVLKKSAVTRNKFMSILEIIEINPNFFGIGLNINNLIKAMLKKDTE